MAAGRHDAFVGGFATTTLLFLTWMKLKDLDTGSSEPISVSKNTLILLNFAFPVLVAQIILGVWLSSNYAAFACPDFPLCQGQILPDTNFQMDLTFAKYWTRLLRRKIRSSIQDCNPFSAQIRSNDSDFYFVAFIASFYSENLKKYSGVLSFFLFFNYS